MTREQVEKWPTSAGKTHYLRFIDGEKLTMKQRIVANLAFCNCGYVDGREDCAMPFCPFYDLMPYNKNKIKLRTVSDEQKAEMSTRMKKRSKGKS